MTPFESSFTNATSSGLLVACRFGGTVVRPLTISDTQLTCVAPPAAAVGNDGALHVWDGEASASSWGRSFAPVFVSVNGVEWEAGLGGSSFFYYPQPLVTSASPSVGTAAGGTLVSLRGSGFFPTATLSCIIRFTSAHPPPIIDESSQYITLSVPALATSPSGAECLMPPQIPRTLSLATLAISANGDAENAMPPPDEGSLTFLYTPDVSILSISPTNGPLSGGTLLTITTSSLTTIGLNAVCRFNSVASVPAFLVSISSTQLQCVTPPFLLVGASDPTLFITVEVSINGGADFSDALSTFQYKRGVGDAGAAVGLSTNRSVVSSGDLYVRFLSPLASPPLASARFLDVFSSVATPTPLIQCRIGGPLGRVVAAQIPPVSSSSDDIGVIASCSLPDFSLSTPPSRPSADEVDALVPVFVTINGGIDWVDTRVSFKFLPEPIITAVTPSSVAVGQDVIVSGRGFVNSLDLACRFSLEVEEGVGVCLSIAFSPTRIA